MIKEILTVREKIHDKIDRMLATTCQKYVVNSSVNRVYHSKPLREWMRPGTKSVRQLTYIAMGINSGFFMGLGGLAHWGFWELYPLRLNVRVISTVYYSIIITTKYLYD